MDPPERNEAMVENLALPFPLESDAKGGLGKRCGLWNDDIGVAVLTIVVADAEGLVRATSTQGTTSPTGGETKKYSAPSMG